MNEPKKIWLFDHYNPKIIGPCEIVRVIEDGNCLCYKHDNSAFVQLIPKDKAIYTRKQAVKECYKYHEERIKQKHQKLNKEMQLLKKFYLEELYE
jgi:hypothetical protein